MTGYIKVANTVRKHNNYWFVENSEGNLIETCHIQDDQLTTYFLLLTLKYSSSE